MRILKIAALMVAIASLAVAMPIVGLYSTGLVAGGGSLSTAGSVEASWVLSGGTAHVTAGSPSSFPFSYAGSPIWVANNADSQWISPQTDYYGGGTYPSDANGNYTYTLTFDLTGYDSSTAWFSYLVAADNTLTSLTLNGGTIPGGGAGLTSLSGEYTVNSGFLAGINTIVATVNNFSENATGNPTGFRLEVTESDVQSMPAQVPEPATFALVGLALAALPVLRRRR